MDLLILFLAGSLTALATGLGAIPVFLLGEKIERFQPFLWGLAAGVMTVAAVAGLLLPAFDDGGSTTAPVIGLVVGLLFLLGSKVLLQKLEVKDQGTRSSLLVFIVLSIHSLPEGFALGTAFASDTVGLSLFVFLAIALQNIPEGTSLAIPMASIGKSRSSQFWSAVLTSLPQPFGAVIAYLLVEQFEELLPISFAFAAGAMLALVFAEIVPQAFQRRSFISALAGTMLGTAIMLVLDIALGV